MDLREMGWEVVGRMGVVQGVRSCEHDNEPSGLNKSREFLY
jgi:hypothetical protein